MPLDKNFLDTVEKLRKPLMGTELMGPLLYSLIRSTRPRSVVEAGMGYTSPFIVGLLLQGDSLYLYLHLSIRMSIP